MDKCCEGCKKAAPGTNMECLVYGVVPSACARVGLCPFNLPVAETKKDFVRVGQQKQKKKGKKK